MSNTPSTDTDPWDRPLDDGRSHKEGSAPSNAIPDDWDEETSSGEEDNQIIWDNANKQVPMPQLVVTSPSVVPPASAFQSPIRILKRSTAPPTHQKKGDDASGDSSSFSSPGSASMSASAGTFAERSARYNAARERIFAAAGTTEAAISAGTPLGSSSSSSTGTGVEGATGDAVSAIIRNPKGPEPVQGPNGQGREGSQGFGIRTGKRGSSGQPNEKQVQDSGLGTK
ncbi:hypothetical protein F5888DRAFT_1357033 [Russula emetica]|nr:hypothetical protein F5888DRAFT_1357033 [Russula emetica]